MSADPRGPSGTGHDTAAPSMYEGTPKPHGIACRCSECAPPVAVPGPASVSPAEPPEAADERGAAETRAAKWKPFVLLHTVIEQSESSLRTEAMIVLEQLRQRVEDGEALGDA